MGSPSPDRKASRRTGSEARSLAGEIRALQKEASLGRAYREELRKEVRRLAGCTVPAKLATSR